MAFLLIGLLREGPGVKLGKYEGRSAA